MRIRVRSAVVGKIGRGYSCGQNIARSGFGDVKAEQNVRAAPEAVFFGRMRIGRQLLAGRTGKVGSGLHDDRSVCFFAFQLFYLKLLSIRRNTDYFVARIGLQHADIGERKQHEKNGKQLCCSSPAKCSKVFLRCIHVLNK